MSEKGAGVKSGLSYQEPIGKHMPRDEGQGQRPGSKGTTIKK